MQTIISLVFMLAGGFVAYGYATGDGTYLLGGLLLSVVLLVTAIVEDVQTHEKKVEQ